MVTYRPQGPAINGSAYRLYLVDDTQPLAPIPNNDQGWGRVSLSNMVLQAPDSDRGPKLFMDQRHALTANGQEYQITIAPSDLARPLRITIAWTDAAAGAGANPALVNDLDLEVTELTTGTIYKGNVFNNGFSYADASDPNDTFDPLNNVECVYILNPVGTYEVRVIAANLMASARPDIVTPWQDFALVIDNADIPAADPVSVVPVLDRSGSMVSSGYVDTTQTASKQFIDSMSINDELAVVSFGDDGQVEYPAGPSPSLQSITGDPIKNLAGRAVDRITFNGCTYMGDGIIKARDLLTSATGTPAIVLFSDGKDNKGCAQSDPTRLSALDAAATLPADMALYTCAMGPASDQSLLQQLAELAGGRYYFMPTIDDLYEIYNYIRGQVTSTGIIVNESAEASSSRVSAFVDALTEEVTFSITWGDESLRYVPRDPRRNRDIGIRLRDPSGKLLSHNSAYVQRIVGKGYVLFKIQEPRSGRWYIEVETTRRQHTRYTVGGFVKSGITTVLPRLKQQIAIGMPLKISTQVFDRQRLVTGFRTKAQLRSPQFTISTLANRYRKQLQQIQLPAKLGDNLDPTILKLTILRDKLRASDGIDIFAPITTTIQSRELGMKELGQQGLSQLIPGFNVILEPQTGLSPQITPLSQGSGSIGSRPEFDVSTALESLAFAQSAPLPTSVLANVSRNLSSAMGSIATPHSFNGVKSGVALTQLPQIKLAGSHNVIITTSGTSPASNTRFIRKDLVSLVVK